MNKKQFINELEKRLKVLNENERKDIINEYSDIINEKVKNGETEEQAVLEFGNIDELIREILNSYKINPDYDDGFGKKAKKVANDTEDYIKRGAKKLADTTQNVIDDFKNPNSNLTLESLFEIIIKVFIFLIILAVMRIPFHFLNFLGLTVFGDIFSPLDFGFNIIWKIVVFLLYVICATIVGIIFFKKYFKNFKITKNGSNVDSNENNSEVTYKKENTSTNTSEYNNIDTLNSNNNSAKKQNSVLSIILKIAVVIFVMFPLVSVIFGLSIAAAVCLYLFIIGVPLLGVFITLLGLCIGAGWLFNLFNCIAFTKKKFHISIFFISIIISVAGGLICANEVLSIDYYNEAPNIDYAVYDDTIKLDNKLYIKNICDKKIIIDDDLEDGEVIVKIEYYDTLIDMEKEDLENGSIEFRLNLSKKSTKEVREVVNVIIDNLKDNKIYDYGYLFGGQATITVNSNTKDKVIIN